MLADQAVKAGVAAAVSTSPFPVLIIMGLNGDAQMIFGCEFVDKRWQYCSVALTYSVM